MASDPQYYLIVDGIRRCVAANMVGLAAVFAKVTDEYGRIVNSGLIELAWVFSPESGLDRREQGRNFDDLLDAMRSVAGRAEMAQEPPTVTLLAADYAVFFTPVADVIITSPGVAGDDD